MFSIWGNSLKSSLLTMRRGIAQLAGRPHLAGSGGEGFPEHLQDAHENYPHVLFAENLGIDKHTNPEDCASALKSIYRKLLTKYGAILLRSFPLGDVELLNAFLRNLGDHIKPMSYKSGLGIRKNMGGFLYTASDEAKEFTIEGHSEMSYTSNWPTLLVFGCKVPAGVECGGETVLVDARQLYKDIDRTILDEFERRGGVRYNTHLKKDADHAGFSWTNAFDTKDKFDVQQFLKERNMEYFFDDDDSITYWITRPLTIKHHLTGEYIVITLPLGENVFFNQVTAMHGTYTITNYPDVWKNVPFEKMPYHTLFGDGSEIPDDYIQYLRNLSWKLAVGVRLQKADVLLIDNELMQHGRMSFSGERTLMTALLQEA